MSEEKTYPGLLDSKRFTDVEKAIADLTRRVAALEKELPDVCRRVKGVLTSGPHPCVWCKGRGERLYNDGTMHLCTRCRGTGKEPT